MRRAFCVVSFLARAGLAPASARGASASGTAAASAPPLEPGQETRVELPRAQSHAMVYVPTDYAPGIGWPLVLCYHPAGGEATTWPFRQVTRGEGFVVAGIEYQTDAYYQRLAPELTGPERQYLEELIALLRGRLNVDPQMVFLGGFSQGGYSVSVIGEQMLDRLAGLVILGAGRRTHNPPARASIYQKPIFIGVGAMDEKHAPAARLARQFYAGRGADVTFEEWPQLGHAMDEASVGLRQWLVENGPLRRARTRLAEARQAEQSGLLGQAYILYASLARLSPEDQHCRAAAKAADALERHAQEQLAAAESAATEGRPAVARRILEEMRRRFTGSAFAAEAEARLARLPSAPGR